MDRSWRPYSPPIRNARPEKARISLASRRRLPWVASGGNGSTRNPGVNPAFIAAVLELLGRSDRIRTYDPLVPNEVRYQTALHSDTRAALRGTPGL